MTQNRRLRSADQLLGPAIEQTIEALGAPEADNALIALVRRQAHVIDSMPDGVAVAMLPNHTGQLIKTLTQLETRAAQRRQLDPGRPNKLQQLRDARAASDARRKRL